MSSIRALTAELAARSDESLRGLFTARPDLLQPPVPDFAALAARSCARVSVQRALETLDEPALQVLEAVHLTTDEDAGRSASSRSLKPLIAGSSLTALDSILKKLQALALLYRAGTSAPASYYPVSTLKEVIGLYPAGLGRRYAELVRAQPAFAERSVALVAQLAAAGHPLAAASSPAEAADALEEWLGSGGALESLLAGAPPKTVDLLRRFSSWAVGALPNAQRIVSFSDSAEQSPVDWLLARGLLVPLDSEHVELPFGVGVGLRGAIVTDFRLAPPRAELALTRASLRRNAALGSIAETLRLLTDLVQLVRAAPLATLRAGGVGVRELRRLSDGLRVEPQAAAVLLEMAALAGLLRLDVDTSHWVAEDDEWRGLPRPEQWLWVVAAWLGSDRAPSLVGEPLPAVRSGAPATINPLAGEAQRPDAPLIRLKTLGLMRELTEEAGGDAATAPVLTAEAVLARAEWSNPRLLRRFRRLVPGILAEAELLGLTGSGALTPAGLAVAEGDGSRARSLLEESLPAAVDRVLLQADLTAVAPGYLAPELSNELLTLADAEGQGPATIYRFSAASIRRALDAGRDAASILDFLGRHAATAIPQPLAYLVEDTASRYGRLHVGAAGSYLAGDDEAALAELLHHPRSAQLGLRRLAPTVLIARAGSREVAAVLRELGHSPALDDGEEQLLRLRRPAAAAALRPSLQAAGPRLADDESVAAQLAVLRSRPAVSPASAEGGPQLGIETLRRAIRQKKEVRMRIVDGQGNHRQEVLVPLAVAGGRVRVFDPRRDTERVVSVHRVMDVELIDEQPGN